jgi:hypothetical protein
MMERKSRGIFPSDLIYKPKRTETENEVRPHALIPMHKKLG